MPRLNKRFVDSLTADLSAPDRTVWDDALPGFGLRLRSTGAKTWIIMYRLADGRQGKFTIGRAGTLTPDEARTLARQKLAAVGRGEDPAAEKIALRRAMTVSELCDIYSADAEARMKPTTFKTDQSRIACHVKPLLGPRKVSSLTMRDIEQLQIDIAAGKTRQSRRPKGRGDHASGGRGVAARTISMVGTMLEFARRRGIVETNVARGVQKFSIPKRDRFLSPEEYAALGRAIRSAEQSGENTTALNSIVALALTGCRRTEILALRWDWLDPRGRCIRFADTKTGPQLRPLGQVALNHLASQPRLEACPWIFPSINGEGHFIGAPRVFRRICDEAGIVGATLHTLRHSFATFAVELGFSELVISGLLGHRGSSVTARYAHVPDRALLAAADSVADAIQKALANQIADVIPIGLRAG